MKVTVHAFCDDTYLRNIEERGWVVSIDTESRCILKYYKEHREAGEDYLFLINKKE